MRARERRGFTIIEVIVVVVILGVLAAVIGPRLLGRVGQSRQTVARSNGAALATAMGLYKIDCGPPEPGATLTVLWERPSNVAESKWQGPYVDSVKALLDPWDNPFHLVVPGQENVDFDIVSYGSDGQPGGEGEAADIVTP